MSELKQFFRNSQVMAAMTALSRVFGLVRDQLTNFLLGTTRLADIWVIAFMLPNLFRRLMAEGVMSSAFVPLLSEITATDEDAPDREAEALAFARAMFSLILLAATLLITGIVLTLPWILPFLMKWMTPSGRENDPEFYARLILPTRLLFPYILFISLAAICQGVLNVKNRFALPSFTPIVLNICIIGFGFGLRHWHGNPLWGLCVGVLVGGFFQFFLQWLQLHRIGFRLAPTLRIMGPRTREAIRLWFPTTFSAGIVQINALISTAVAANLFEGASMALFNSTRMMELVLGVFAAAISTSILPLLSRQRGRDDRSGLNNSLWAGLTVMSLVTIPAAVGLILAGPSMISLLFQRGAFNDHSLNLTYTALLFHAMALIPIAWYRILSQTFYAHKQVLVSVAIAGVAAVVNIYCCFRLPTLFDRDLAHCGIALATLISSWLLMGIALWQIYRRYQVRWPRVFTWDLVRITLATAAFVPLWLPFGIELLSPFALILKIISSILVYIILIYVLQVSALPRILRKK
ncbi:murein biosynthesis integral membrane protein MurJ [Sulfidibacter corallicola]|uniref:Probable lipid II flippase MurJ n=1 Tax=Sulfidibacter corallicola TaxID=2818388 RepID=A0A8A4TQZ6_SULCO|nr:murein biosynthesis integral membrane protein MurJ [Sulfidibacter corallicola]QTD51614.1 murein biosynthesis integral membrane protein MurJ [Sulfidibacter corallicola]